MLMIILYIFLGIRRLLLGTDVPGRRHRLIHGHPFLHLAHASERMEAEDLGASPMGFCHDTHGVCAFY
jgi:hypothetical protein